MEEIIKIAIPTGGLLFAYLTWYIGKTIADSNRTTKNTADIDAQQKQLGLHEKRLDGIDEMIRELIKIK